MIEHVETKLSVTSKIDPITYRHYLNEIPVVVHCHHYSTLYTQLAMDAGETDLLKSVAAEMFYEMLTEYFEKEGIDSISERIKISQLYFAVTGLGKMEVVNLGVYGGLVRLTRSHVDRGWIRKWGNSDKPVNYIGMGCIAGMASAVFDKTCSAFDTKESKSLVKGDPYSEVNIFRT